MGCEYSRHDRPGEPSKKPSRDPARDIYRHPCAQGFVSISFTKTFDVYVQLSCCWRSCIGDLLQRMHIKLKDITERTQKVRGRVVDEDDKDQIPHNLRLKMGNEYTKLVLCCLGKLFKDESLSAKDFSGTYFELIVRKLERCVV